jgi:hypothetical protein
VNVAQYQKGWGRRRPPVAFGVDWTHPISRKMFDCLLFNEFNLARVRNLAAPISNAAAAGTNSWRVTARGLGIFCDNSTLANNSNVNFADHGSLVGADFTVEVLFRPETYPSGFSCICAKMCPGSHREVGIFADTSGNISFIEIGGTSVTGSATPGMTTGQVWHLVMTRAGTAVKCYVNGVVAADTLGTSSATTTGANPFRLGYDEVNNANNGINTYLLARTWTRALSVGEIQLLWQQPYCNIWQRPPIRGSMVATAAAASVQRYNSLSLAPSLQIGL